MSESKFEFLQAAITDAQELIKFTETKTALAITVLGAYIFAYFSAIDDIIKYANGYSFWFWLYLVIFLSMLILCVCMIIRIIKPNTTYIKNIILGTKQPPDIPFFLTPNKYPKGIAYGLRNSEKYKLNVKYEKFIDKLNVCDEGSLIESLTMELFKVSYIRNLKNDRFKLLINMIILTTIAFLISYFFLKIETYNTIFHNSK